MFKDGGRTSVSQDFGLRSIKGITEIADNLKQKCMNITYCELPDIINKEQMGMVNWQGQDLIKDVIASYQIKEQEGKESASEMNQTRKDIKSKRASQVSMESTKQKSQINSVD